MLLMLMDGHVLVVFNQTPGAQGLRPLIPQEVGVVFPHRNRQLLFKGDLFHGVLVSEQ